MLCGSRTDGTDLCVSATPPALDSTFCPPSPPQTRRVSRMPEQVREILLGLQQQPFPHAIPLECTRQKLPEVDPQEAVSGWAGLLGVGGEGGPWCVGGRVHHIWWCAVGWSWTRGERMGEKAAQVCSTGLQHRPPRGQPHPSQAQAGQAAVGSAPWGHPPHTGAGGAQLWRWWSWPTPQADHGGGQ